MPKHHNALQDLAVLQETLVDLRDSLTTLCRMADYAAEVDTQDVTCALRQIAYGAVRAQTLFSLWHEDSAAGCSSRQRVARVA
jgi:hypothetical protein